MRDWPDHDLVNTKQGWESLGVINGNLISGEHQDYAGNFYQIPQTMAGIEIEIDSDEFKKKYIERLQRSHHKQFQRPNTKSVQ